MTASSIAPKLYAWPLADGGAHSPLVAAPESNRGFREASSYGISCPPGFGWSFLVDDQPLEFEAGAGRWIWRPGFYAGEVTAELRNREGATTALYLLDVSPDDRKVGREMFATMVEELWAADPRLVFGEEPATRSVGFEGAHTSPLLEYSRLRRHVPGFLNALAGVRAQPRRSVLSARVSTPMHRVRHVDRRTAKAALRKPELAAFFAGVEAPASAGLEPYLDAPVIEETLDSAATRCLLSLIQQVHRRVRSVFDALEAAAALEVESDTRTALRNRWPERRALLRRIDSSLRAFCRQRPFSEATRAEKSAAGLNAVAADPLYSRAWASGWRALRSGLDGPPTDDRLWISPTWEIYERWCFVRLGALLQNALPELEWNTTERHPTRALCALDGRSSGGSLQLLLQPEFPGEKPTKRHDCWSVSKRRIPDLVLVTETPRRRRMWVLDAKYLCARRSVLDAMTSAHIYQDSLRIGDERPVASLLLLPAASEAPWLEKFDFHEEHRVGVAQLAPGALSELPPLVQRGIASEFGGDG